MTEHKGVPSFRIGVESPPDSNGIRTQTFDRTWDNKHVDTLTLYLHPDGTTCLGPGAPTKPEPTSNVPYVCMNVAKMLRGMAKLKLEANPHTITFPRRSRDANLCRAENQWAHARSQGLS